MIILLLGLAGLIDCIVFMRLIRRFRTMRFEHSELPGVAELPTVTICITARNETHAMTRCLEHVVASEYPKLEII